MCCELTFDVQHDVIAFSVSLDVGGGARNVSRHVSADVLQYEALIGDDDICRHVVNKFHALLERKKEFNNNSKQRGTR